jgi:hypothetical protein
MHSRRSDLRVQECRISALQNAGVIITLKAVRLNSETLELSPGKPFDLLRNENLVLLSGATGNRNLKRMQKLRENRMFF